MIGKSVSTSRRLAGVSDEAKLLWSWALAHTDRDGCVPGDPSVLRAVVVPMLEWTSAAVGDYRDELVDAGLWVMGEARGSVFARFARFREGQQGMRYDREAASKWAPESGLPPDDSGATPEDSGPDPEDVCPKQSKANQGKGSEVKRRRSPPARPDSPEARAILEMLERSPAARRLGCATTRAAEVLEGIRISAGRPMSEASDAVRQCLADADMAEGSDEPWKGDRLRRSLRRFIEEAGKRSRRSRNGSHGGALLDADAIAARADRLEEAGL